MGKKSAHTGESAKDRSINMMDKFITKNSKIQSRQAALPAMRKDSNVPISMWPLKDQIEYWDTKSSVDYFNEKYPVYSYWIDAVRKASKVHPTFFNDQTIKLKPLLAQLFESKTPINDTVKILQTHGIY